MTQKCNKGEIKVKKTMTEEQRRKLDEARKRRMEERANHVPYPIHVIDDLYLDADELGNFVLASRYVQKDGTYTFKNLGYFQTFDGLFDFLVHKTDVGTIRNLPYKTELKDALVAVGEQRKRLADAVNGLVGDIEKLKGDK